MSKNCVLAVLCGVVAMTVIDLSVVNVALPSIQADLGVSPANLQWVVVTYGVAVAGFLLLGGRLGDLFGHRLVLLVGVAVLMASSLLGGVSGSFGLLIAARAGQGLGAALAAPNALGILSRTFTEGPERNRALGIFGAAGGTAAVAGSIVGGLLVQGPGWPWVFFLNVPAGAALVTLVLARIPADARRADRSPVDVTGAAALTGGLAAVTFGVHQRVDAGWLSARTLVPLLAGFALIGAFGLIEARVAQPLIPLATLGRRSLIYASLCAGLLWASFLGLIYAATLFVQQVLHWSPLAAGASTIPIAVLSLAGSALVAPWLIARIGSAQTVALGMAILGAGLLLLLRAPSDANYLADIAPAYMVIGTGLGLTQVAVQIAAFAGIEASEVGLAGGAIETAREMGGAFGLALLVSVAPGRAADMTDTFHRSAVAGAVFAGLSALIAIILLRAATTRPVAHDRTRHESGNSPSASQRDAHTVKEHA